METLKQWLKEAAVTHVAMENTGLYWKPVFNILEDEQWEIVLANNARRFKNVPARKTGVQDCDWLCHLLRWGLLRSSFIPPDDIRQLRTFAQHQNMLQRQIQIEKNRVLELLQECNIKITEVLSDVFGEAGMKILTDLSKGITHAETLARHIEEDKRLHPKKARAVACLKGKFGRTDQFLLKMRLDTIAFYQQQTEVLAREADKLKKSCQSTPIYYKPYRRSKSQSGNPYTELSLWLPFRTKNIYSQRRSYVPAIMKVRKKSSQLKHANNHLRGVQAAPVLCNETPGFRKRIGINSTL